MISNLMLEISCDCRKPWIRQIHDQGSEARNNTPEYDASIFVRSQVSSPYNDSILRYWRAVDFDDAHVFGCLFTKLFDDSHTVSSHFTSIGLGNDLVQWAATRCTGSEDGVVWVVRVEKYKVHVQWSLCEREWGTIARPGFTPHKYVVDMIIQPETLEHLFMFGKCLLITVTLSLVNGLWFNTGKIRVRD